MKIKKPFPTDAEFEELRNAIIRNITSCVSEACIQQGTPPYCLNWTQDNINRYEFFEDEFAMNQMKDLLKQQEKRCLDVQNGKEPKALRIKTLSHPNIFIVGIKQ